LDQTCEYRLNYDGLFGWGKQRNSSSTMSEFSLQIFNNGVFEAIYTQYVDLQNKYINPNYERDLVKELDVFLSLQKQLSASLPLFITLSLLGVQGCIMNYKPVYFREVISSRPLPQGRRIAFEGPRELRYTPIDRDNLLIPGVIIDDFELDIPKETKVIFDSVWAAAGWEQSMNYNENTGEWINIDKY
jgi:hypothetical protein